MINLYYNKNKAKWIIVSSALLIGLFSLLYTNWLVKQLAEREKKQVQLYARSLEFIISLEPSENLNTLFEEVIVANESVPCIVADEHDIPYDARNIRMPEGLNPFEKRDFLEEKMQEMKEEYEPIEINLEGIRNYVYYSNSRLITLLRYYPYIQLTVIGILGILAYFIFSTTRKAEQNRVWVGLAKETAHQLGTPISSLMAWIEYLRADNAVDESILTELSKDTQRLEMITSRFSSIGSVPVPKSTDVLRSVRRIVTYLRKRVSTKVRINIVPKHGEEFSGNINEPLFEWVIENLCKNAVDAMSGVGKIDIFLRNSRDNKTLMIDISDTGKGIPKSKLKTVFQPGFTTKKRGWGLGLTLVKRIVEEYHQGKIFVWQSEPGVGTTFRILIPKK
ncbi:HAMP domain-containing sensor histidine kinase [Rapidithrix thailandica]|uniref:histidine kinase n=1 Tax=Rapidithrix thailandica TaxID=413964 RepID=A0AAW9RP36_9BACT